MLHRKTNARHSQPFVVRAGRMFLYWHSNAPNRNESGPPCDARDGACTGTERRCSEQLSGDSDHTMTFSRRISPARVKASRWAEVGPVLTPDPTGPALASRDKQ